MDNPSCAWVREGNNLCVIITSSSSSSSMSSTNYSFTRNCSSNLSICNWYSFVCSICKFCILTKVYSKTFVGSIISCPTNWSYNRAFTTFKTIMPFQFSSSTLTFSVFSPTQIWSLISYYITNSFVAQAVTSFTYYSLWANSFVPWSVLQELWYHVTCP